MVCPNCGVQLPPNCDFCKYCGTRLSPENASHPGETVPPVIRPEEKSFCTECGTALDPVTGSCPRCSMPPMRGGSVPVAPPASGKSRKKTMLPIVLLSLFLVIALGLNVIQLITGISRADKVTSLQARVNVQDQEIEQLEEDYADIQTELNLLEGTAESYEELCDALAEGGLGRGSDDFYTSESVFLVSPYTVGRSFTLTTSWNGEAIISHSYSSDAAWVEFSSDTWADEVEITIFPDHEGITRVTFENDYDYSSFDVVIIVKE